MPLTYDDKAIIPAPFMTSQKEVLTSGGGAKKLSSVMSITLHGKIVAWRGSPKSDASFWTASGYPPDETIVTDARLAAVLIKQNALRALFANEGRNLEISSPDGSFTSIYQPRNIKIDFAEGNWVEVCDYTVTMEVDDPNDNTDKIRDASEEWAIEASDERGVLFRLTHQLSATGKRVYDETGALANSKEAWQNAESYVLTKIGLGLKPARMEAPGVLDATGLQAFNYVRSNQLNELAGTYGVTETWVCFEPGDAAIPAHEDFTVTAKTNGGRTTVTIDGTITGLEKRDDTTRALVSNRYDNAVLKWDNVRSTILARVELVSGFTLNPTVINKSVGRNELSGTITYSYEYNDRPEPSIVGALTQIVRIHNANPADVYASVPVLGRELGPVLQNVGSKTSRKKTVTIDVNMPAATMSGTSTKPETDGLVLDHIPSGSQVFTDQDENDWDEDSGHYTRTVVFTWQS